MEKKIRILQNKNLKNKSYKQLKAMIKNKTYLKMLVLTKFWPNHYRIEKQKEFIKAGMTFEVTPLRKLVCFKIESNFSAN